MVIPTKNRPRTLARLLDCVKRQTLREIEVIVIDDGSSQDTLSAYPAIWSKLDERFQLHCQPSSGGPGAARNAGIRLARSEFVAFCDDDDLWVRKDHLETATAALTRFAADLYLANMRTSVDGIVDDPDWYGKGGQVLKRFPLDPEQTLFAVRRADLARFLENRILPANTLVVRYELITGIGLYWDKIGFAEDHELSFRLADGSRKTLYSSVVAADADVTPHPSVARCYDYEDSIFFDLLAIMHAEYHLRDARLRRAARRNRSSRMMQLSELLAARGRRREALSLAYQSAVTSWRRGTVWQIAKITFGI